MIALLLLTAVAAVAAYVVSSRRADDSLRQALTAGTCDVDTESDRISGADGHVPSPSYTVDPPAGGEHLNSVARDGVVVAEREGMSTLVAATAWGQRLLCGEVEPQALVGNGPEDVQRGQAARSPVTR